jgi:branched-chain amino acid transport system permease protein
VFSGRFEVFGVIINVDKLALIIIGITVTLFLFWVYEKTNIGRAMRAVAFNDEVSSLHGINANWIYMLVIGIGTALAGFAGGIIAPSYGMSPTMGSNILWSVMLMTMLGGMDSLVGAVVGGAIIGQMLSFGQYYIGSTVQIIIFLAIGIVLYFKPAGLLGRGIDIGI